MQISGSSRWRAERGEGAVSYLLVILLIAALVAALVAGGGIGGRVSAHIGSAVCRVLEAGHLVDRCEQPPAPPRPPVPITDPDKPTGACLLSIENEYVMIDASVQIRIFQVLTDGGGWLQLRHFKKPDGTEEWQVWDMGWSALGGGVGLPARYQNKGINASLWAYGAGDHTNIYSFDNEDEARKFYNNLKDYRIGNWAKLAVRTNPVSGGINWLLTKIPGIGDDIDEFMGGKEPDRKPTQEYWDAALWEGFTNNISLNGLPLSVAGKNFGWTSGGVWTDHKTGETTYFFQASQLLMESLVLDVGKTLKKLGLSKTPPNIQKAITQLEKELTTKAGTPVTLPPVIRNALATSIGLGVGLRGSIGRWYGLTYDKNGKPAGFQQIDDVAGSWQLRGDIGVGPLSAWLQDSQGGTRWRTTKTLDLKDAKDNAAFQQFLAGLSRGDPIGSAFGLDRYFDAGGGTMSKVDYDYHVQTTHPGINLGVGALEVEDEKSESYITQGEYYKPGVGWLKWDTCGSH